MKTSAVPVVLWAPGLYLVGDGPSYLLFRTEGRQVIHLTSTSELSRKERKALKGYPAIKDGKLVSLVQALIDFRIDAYFSSKEDAIRCGVARWLILMEISNLIDRSSEDKIFKTRSGKFISAIKATRQLKKIQRGPLIPPITSDSWASWARGVSWTRDIYGNQMVIYSVDRDKPSLVFSCVPNSQIASCALKLWRQEPTSLYCIPYRKELGEYLCLDEPAITKLCCAEGFDWLPRAPVRGGAGRRRILASGAEQEIGAARNSPTASHDLQPAATHTGHRTNRTTQPAPAGPEELLREVALWRP